MLFVIFSNLVQDLIQKGMVLDTEIGIPLLRTSTVDKAVQDLLVLFILPPGSSPVGWTDEDDGGKRLNVVQEFATAWIPSVIYPNLGKPFEFNDRTQREWTVYSFEQTVKELTEVLSYLKGQWYPLENIVLSTSSLGIIPTTKLLADHPDLFNKYGYPTVMVGSPISDLAYVLQKQIAYQLGGKKLLNHPGYLGEACIRWISRTKFFAAQVAKAYETANGLTLAPDFIDEISNPQRRNTWIATLIELSDSHEFPVYFYGNQGDVYRRLTDTASLNTDIPLLFEDTDLNDPFSHILTSASQLLARAWTLDFIREVLDDKSNWWEE